LRSLRRRGPDADRQRDRLDAREAALPRRVRVCRCSGAKPLGPKSNRQRRRTSAVLALTSSTTTLSASWPSLSGASRRSGRAGSPRSTSISGISATRLSSLRV